jgi:hypothetical protein
MWDHRSKVNKNSMTPEAAELERLRDEARHEFATGTRASHQMIMTSLPSKDEVLQDMTLNEINTGQLMPLLARDSTTIQAAAIQLSIAQRHLLSKQFLRDTFTLAAYHSRGFGVPVPETPRHFPDDPRPKGSHPCFLTVLLLLQCLQIP